MVYRNINGNKYMASRHSRKEAFHNIVSTLKDKPATHNPQQVSVIHEAEYEDNRGIMKLRGFEAGKGISIEIQDADNGRFRTDETKLVFSVIDDAGEANNGENVGPGAGVFKDKQGVNLRFKSLVANSGIQIVEHPTHIVISTVGTGTLYEVNIAELLVPSGGPYVSITFFNIYTSGIPTGADVFNVTINGLDIRKKQTPFESGWEFSTVSGNLIVGPLNYLIEQYDEILILFKV